MKIPFNKVCLSGKELEYIQEACENGKLSGDGVFTKRCHTWFENFYNCPRVLLTHSCTGALEMSALLVDIQPGDEVIMPSYTFSSTANAFVLRGGIPVFVDIREDTLNIDETLIERAITPKTKAIVVVHYAGVGCEMTTIQAIAKKYKLYLIEDAAQGILATYKGQQLGTFGHLNALSFHDTKNIIAGEGGAIIITDPEFILPAEMIREKGTDRSKFLRGQVDKYTWQTVGASYLPSELNAAFLFAQLERAREITQERLRIWEMYHQAFAALEQKGKVRRPIIPAECQHNAHMYYLLFHDETERNQMQENLKKCDIQAVSHYVPLHDAPAGLKFTKTVGTMNVTDRISRCLLRLPLYFGLSDSQVKLVIQTILEQY